MKCVHLVAGAPTEVTLRQGTRTVQVYAPKALGCTWLQNESQATGLAAWPLSSGASLPLIVPEGVIALRLQSQENTTVTLAEV